MVGSVQDENGKSIVFKAYVGGVFLSPELDSVIYHQNMKVAIINVAGLPIYDHRQTSTEAVFDWIYGDLEWEAVRRALNRPAFVQVKEKNGGQPYLVLFSIPRVDKEEKPEVKRPHFLLSLWRFPDGGPIEIVSDGSLWQRRYIEDGTWNEEMIAVTTGYVPKGSTNSQGKPSLPRHLMIFHESGDDDWYILGSKVTQTNDLGDLSLLVT